MLVYEIPPFKLYGLVGCPHCSAAESYLRQAGLPLITIVANDDPIVQAGVAQIVGQPEYPILLCTLEQPMILVKGFKRDEYDRLRDLYRTKFGLGLPNGASGPELSNGQAQAPSA